MPDGVCPTEESKQLAIKHFAEEQGRNVEDVTLQEIIASHKGFMFYTLQGKDCTIRGAEGQRFKRASSNNPVMLEMYKDLVNAEKDTFRECWQVSYAFELTTTERVRTNSWVKETQQNGQWLTELQIAKAFGGVQQQQCLDQARNYCEMAATFGPKMKSYHK